MYLREDRVEEPIASRGVEEIPEELLPADSLFFFDPNTATKEEFLALGLSPRLAQTIVNYRSKGGRFRKPEDLLRIYGFKQSDYDRLKAWVKVVGEPSISAPIQAGQIGSRDRASSDSPARGLAQEHPRRRQETQQVSIAVNSATQEDWQKLRGIGPAYSRRIVSFREKLGGFYSIDQIGETYGLPDSVFQKIKPYLVLDRPPYRLLKVNTLQPEELAAHPYLKWAQVKILVAYRNQHGDFATLDEVYRALEPLMDEKGWERLKPYISLDR